MKNVNYLNRYLKFSYINDHIANQVESKLMDTTLNPKTRVKITILNEIIIYIFYDASNDLHEMNNINNKLIEALYSLFKTKKIKLEQIIKRYTDMSIILEDTMYNLDPRVRITLNKNEAFLMRDVISHFNYTFKISQANLVYRSISYLLSSQDFSDMKYKIDTNKSYIAKLNKQSFILDNDNFIHYSNYKRVSFFLLL